MKRLKIFLKMIIIIFNAPSTHRQRTVNAPSTHNGHDNLAILLDQSIKIISIVLGMKI